MEQLSELKKHINSITDIKQMTRAMQLISAVKMRRARSQLEKTMPFFALCAETMVELRDAGVIIDNTVFPAAAQETRRNLEDRLLCPDRRPGPGRRVQSERSCPQPKTTSASR